MRKIVFAPRSKSGFFVSWSREGRILFLYRGEILHDLAEAVPTVANWSMTSIPRGISPDLVRLLLASINRDTAGAAELDVGQRRALAFRGRAAGRDESAS